MAQRYEYQDIDGHIILLFVHPADIAGLVWLAMLGSLYKISDEYMEDEKETKRV